MGINRAAIGSQEWTTAVVSAVRVNEDQGKICLRFDFLAGVTLEKFPGSDSQTLLQAQEVIRAQDDGGGAATLVEAGQIGMTMEFKAAGQGEAGLVHGLIEGYKFFIGSHCGRRLRGGDFQSLI
jgi:hypothetical protein